MSELMWIRSHVERLLEAEWDTGDIRPDADGDWEFQSGTAACWVSVLDSDPIMVRVSAHAATGIRPSYRLMRELNDVQRRCLSCRIDYASGIVVVSQTVAPWGLTQPVLAQAMTTVSAVADDIGTLLAITFGGHTPYQAVEVPDSEDAS